MESYMELCLATCLNMSMYDSVSNYRGVIFSNYFAIVMTIVVFSLPIWICFFYWLKMSTWEDEEFVEKFGAVLEGTRQEYKKQEEGSRWIAIMFPVITLTRRIGFVVSVVFYP